MSISPHLRLGNDALSHQAKRGVVPINRPTKREKKKRFRARVSDDTYRIAYHRTGGRCACGCGRRVERHNPACYHHVFPKQSWPELIDEPNNVVAVAVDCHANHETAAQRFPRKVTRHAALLAEGDPAMREYLDRTYTG